MKILEVAPETLLDGESGGPLRLARLAGALPELEDPFAGRRVATGPIRWLWVAEDVEPRWDHPLLTRADLVYLPAALKAKAPEGGPWLERGDESYSKFLNQAQEDLAPMSAAALNAAAELLRWQPHLSPKPHRAMERAVFALHFCHPDRVEGLSAFLEKRKPKFQE